MSCQVLSYAPDGSEPFKGGKVSYYSSLTQHHGLLGTFTCCTPGVLAWKEVWYLVAVGFGRREVQFKVCDRTSGSGPGLERGQSPRSKNVHSAAVPQTPAGTICVTSRRSESPTVNHCSPGHTVAGNTSTSHKKTNYTSAGEPVTHTVHGDPNFSQD
jgi:hypothetical protein